MQEARHGVSGTVASRIREAMGTLSTKERLVARSVLAHYPVAGLESTAALAEIANVSVPTVVRFVAKVGYSSYKSFQGMLREELTEKNASPVLLETRSTTSAGDGELIPWTSEVIRTSFNRTFKQLPESEAEAAVLALAAAEGNVFTFGGRFTHVLAEYAALNFRALRKNVYYHRDIQDAIAAAAEIGRRDCLLIFDVRRYQPDSIRLARHVKARHGTVILITDPWMSPIAEFADVVLPARVEAPSPMDSLVAPMAIVEVLVAGLHTLLGAKAVDRLQLWESATESVEGRSNRPTQGRI